MAKMYNYFAKIMKYKGSPVPGCRKDKKRWPSQIICLFDVVARKLTFDSEATEDFPW